MFIETKDFSMSIKFYLDYKFEFKYLKLKLTKTLIRYPKLLWEKYPTILNRFVFIHSKMIYYK